MSKKTEWKDETSYARGDVERKPGTVALHTKTLRIVVTRRLKLTGWYLMAHDLRIEDHKLDAEDLEGAKTEALAVVRARCNEILKELASC